MATLARSSSPAGQAIQYSLCRALTRGQLTQSLGPRGWCFCLQLLSRGQSVAKSGSSRRGGLNTAKGSCGSCGSCHQHSKAPIVGQHNQQKLAQSVLPTILRDSTPARQPYGGGLCPRSSRITVLSLREVCSVDTCTIMV